MNVANEDDNQSKNQLTTRQLCLQSSCPCLSMPPFLFVHHFDEEKLVISICTHFGICSKTHFGCVCTLIRSLCFCFARTQNTLQMWWKNFSPSYLNEVNKDEFCSVCVCIILCLLFRKHYYFYVDMVLFALSVLSSIMVCNNDKDVVDKQTTKYTHLRIRIYSERRRWCAHAH